MTRLIAYNKFSFLIYKVQVLHSNIHCSWSIYFCYQLTFSLHYNL